MTTNLGTHAARAEKPPRHHVGRAQPEGDGRRRPCARADPAPRRAGAARHALHRRVPRRKGYDKLAKLDGPGGSPYSRYDRDIAARAQVWLHEEAPELDRPWALFVSFVCPHFPLIAPPEFYYRYRHDRIPLPKQYAPSERPDHPYLREYHGCVGYDDGFGGDHAKVRRAIAGYLGLVSFMDHNVG